MKIKKGASLQGLKIQMRQVLIAADKIWTNFNQELVITSATEDIPHTSRSLHPYGYAVDLRTRYFTDQEKVRVCRLLFEKLKDRSRHYNIVFEKDHIHVEWQGAMGC
jgi:hypothetical protein